MKTTHDQRSPQEPQDSASAPASTPEKQPWQEPKLTFVEPMLTSHGTLEDVTGFFGGFSPGQQKSSGPR